MGSTASASLDRHRGGADDPVRDAAAPARQPHRPGRAGTPIVEKMAPAAGDPAANVGRGDQGREMAQTTSPSPRPPSSTSTSAIRTHRGQRGHQRKHQTALLRQYFAKGTDLSVFPADYLDYVATKLNRRPRQTLGFKTPAEALDELLSNPSKPPAVCIHRLKSPPVAVHRPHRRRKATRVGASLHPKNMTQDTSGGATPARGVAALCRPHAAQTGGDRGRQSSCCRTRAAETRGRFRGWCVSPSMVSTAKSGRNGRL